MATYVYGTYRTVSGHGFKFRSFLTHENVNGTDTTVKKKLSAGMQCSSSGDVGWTNCKVTMNDTSSGTDHDAVSNTKTFNNSNADSSNRVVFISERTWSWTKKASAYTVTVKSTLASQSAFSSSVASWEFTVPALPSYTITANANGGTINPTNTDTSWTCSSDRITATKSVQRSAAISVLPVLNTRTGYTLTGWNTASNGSGTAITTSSTFTAATTIYAQWSAQTSTVTLNANGGSGGTTSVTATYNSAMPTATMPTFSGWTFQGFYDTSAASGGTQYYNASGASVRSWDKTGNQTLYARWSRTVTFKHGKASASSSSVTQYYGGTITPPTIAGISGWTALGWRDDITAGAKEYGANDTTVFSYASSSTTLYAAYSRTLTLSYNANGGSGTAPTGSTATQYYNSYGQVSTASFTLAKNTFTAPSGGYSFSKWGAGNAGASWTWAPGVDAAASTTTYASWTRTITFKHGQGQGSSSSVTQTYGSNITPPAITTISSWTALGWRDDTAASTKEYGSDKATAFAYTGTSTTLYAVYSRTLTITYANGGGTGTAPSNTTTTQYYNTYSTITSPSVNLASNTFTRTGYNFNGWDIGSPYTWNIAVTSTAVSKVATATWSEKTATLTYNNGGHGTAPSNVTMRYTAATNAAGAITASGYQFIGWKRSDNNAIIAAGAQVKAANVIPSALTLTAQWNTVMSCSSLSYNGTYDGNPHSAQVSTNVAGATVEYGTSTSYGYSLTTTEANTDYEMSSVSRTDVGTTTVYYRATKTGYTTVASSTTITITKAANPMTWISTITWSDPYGSGSSGTISAATNAQGAVTYALNSQTNSDGTAVSYFSFDTSTRVLSCGSSTPAGTYTIVLQATAAGNNNYNSRTRTCTATININRVSVGAKPTSTSVSKTYNGSEQNNGYTTPSGVNMSGSNKGTVKGKYIATYTPDSNHKWSDDSTSAVTVTLTINARTVTWNAPTASSSTLTYNGNAKTLASLGSASTGGTMYYYVSDSSTAPTFSTSTWKTTIDTKTDAKTWYIHYICYVSDTTNNTGTNINTASHISKVINKAGISLSVSIANWAYGGTAATPSVSGNTGGGTVTYLYKLQSAADSAYSSTVPSDAGAYIIKATAAATDNYNSATATKNFNITFTATGVAYNGTYDGSAHYASIRTSAPGAVVNYGTSTSYGYSLTCTNANTNYSMSSVAYTDFTNGAKTVYYSATKNGYTTTGSTTVTISKRTVTWTAPTVASGTLEYNGSAKVLATKGNDASSGGIMYFYVSTSSTAPTFSTSTWKTTIDTGTAAGTYYIYYRCYVSDTTNNTGTNINTTYSINKTINQKTVTLTWGTTSWTYDGNTHSTTCTVGGLVSGDSCTVTLSGNSVGANVGSATVTASSLSNSNYKLPSAKTATISITRASVGAKPTTSVIKIYNGSSQNNGYTTPTGVSMSGYNSGTAAGEYTATYTPDGNHCWSDSTYGSVQVVLTINNATLTVSAPNQSYTYNGSAQGKAITASAKGSQTITIKYGTTDGTYNLTSAPQITNVNDSKLIYYQVSAANHNTETGSYRLDITRRTVTPTAPVLTTGTLTYNGQTKTLATAGSCTAGGTMYYYVSNSSTAPNFSTSTWNTSIDAKINAGTYYVHWYCYVSDTANNNDTTTDNINVAKTLNSRTIRNASLSVTAPNQSYTYDGSSHGNAISASSVNSQPITIKYGTTSGSYNLTSAPKITNVNDSKPIYYQVTAPNHTAATGSYNLTITKRTVTITAPSLTTDTLTYNGSSKTLANSGSCSAGGVMYYYVSNSSTAPSFSTSTWQTSIETKINAGTYYIYWYCYVGDTDNNNDTTTDNINVAKSLGSRVINKATMTITPTAYSGDYNGTSHSAQIKSSITNTSIAYGTSTSYGYNITVGTSNVTMSSVTRTNPGVTTIYYKATNPNYTDVTGSTTITITGVPVHTKVNGSWKHGIVYVKVGNTWKKATAGYVKIDGSWKSINK